MAEGSSRTDPRPGAAPWGQGGGRDEYTVDARGGLAVQVGPGGTQNIYSSQRFCRCGNSIQFQCQLCKTGMCWSCDVIEWRQRNQFPRILVPTPGIGYLKKIDRTAAEWSISDNRIMQVGSAGGTIVGPFLYSDDILPGLIEAHALRHVCCACVTAAAVTAAEMIVSGTRRVMRNSL
jgi:hypothetical protein